MCIFLGTEKDKGPGRGSALTVCNRPEKSAEF